jgi:uncharacterized protein (DUF4415 family)
MASKSITLVFGAAVEKQSAAPRLEPRAAPRPEPQPAPKLEPRSAPQPGNAQPAVDWSHAVVTLPARKKAISIRLDEDVLAFFKAGNAAGYQRRINAVLRSYMEQAKAAKPD